MVDVILYVLAMAVSVWFGVGVMYLMDFDDDLGFGPVSRFFLTPFAILVIPLCELWLHLED